MKANQQISVIIPMYNAENTVMKALDSVRLQKGDFVFEIIVVNDGSTDASRNVVENYRKQNPQMNIILLDQPNSGVSKARNAAMEVSGREYIALLDSDDEWLPEKTERQMPYLVNNEENIDFISSRRRNHKIQFHSYLFVFYQQSTVASFIKVFKLGCFLICSLAYFNNANWSS